MMKKITKRITANSYEVTGISEINYDECPTLMFDLMLGKKTGRMEYSVMN